MIPIHYIIITAVSLCGLFWLTVRAFKLGDIPPRSDDGGSGGEGANLPLIDLPPGSGLTILQIDRDPKGYIATTRRPLLKV